MTVHPYAILSLGELIEVALEIDNKSASTLKPKIKLKEEAIFVASGRERKTVVTTRAKVNCGYIMPSNEVQTREVCLEIPDRKISPDMQLPHLWNIKVSHHIEVNEHKKCERMFIPSDNRNTLDEHRFISCR